MRDRSGVRMTYWIGDVLQEEREAAGVTTAQVATALDVDERTIKRLELGQTMGRDIDRTVAAYAYLIGIEDGRDLWREALERWSRDGSPPQFKPSSDPAAAFAEAIRVTALRQQQRDVGPSKARSAIPKKRATG